MPKLLLTRFAYLDVLIAAAIAAFAGISALVYFHGRYEWIPDDDDA